ncbi:baseplate J/gp47 family protein [Fodinicurvata sp. EGI_FJ10296]|uniref:baseplate assembly protein n=1 Tax=Fodinicurvata sp. EGI_FJ10296 TaxID=3231908 RepID=UPI003453335C
MTDLDIPPVRAYAGVDLASFEPPPIVDEGDFEAIHAEMRAEFVRRYPDYSAMVESDPVSALLQANAWRELLLRQRINEASRATLLASARGEDLDRKAWDLSQTRRLLIKPGDPDALPPVPPVWEDDDALRERAQLALYRLSVAGPDNAYISAARDAHPAIKSASVASPEPGRVIVTVLTREGKGVPGPEVLEAVDTALSARDVRPLTDRVEIRAAAILTYRVEARLRVYDGPDAEVVRAEADKRLRTYVAARHRLGDPVTRSGLFAALSPPGVQLVTLDSPADHILPTAHEAAWCEAITITLEE